MRRSHAFALFTMLAGAAAPAVAHPGHGTSLAAGLLHPLTGVDHLAAMLLVGIWAGMLGARMVALLPAAFLAAMLAGFGLGWSTHALPLQAGAELLIVISLLVLGGAVAVRMRSSAGLALAAAGLFGAAHGLSHGLEAAPAAMPLGFAAGFLVSTAMLHLAGLALARSAPLRASQAVGWAGAGLALVLAGTSL